MVPESRKGVLGGESSVSYHPFDRGQSRIDFNGTNCALTGRRWDLGHQVVRVLEHVSGKDGDDARSWLDDPSRNHRANAGNTCGTGRFAADSTGVDFGLGRENLVVADGYNNAIS